MQPDRERFDRGIDIHLSQSQYEHIATIAQRRSRSFAWLVRYALERTFPQEREAKP